MTSSITNLRISPGVTPDTHPSIATGHSRSKFGLPADCITAFAGPDPELAVFYPRDEQFLVDRDLTVRHHQVYGSSGLTARRPGGQAQHR